MKIGPVHLLQVRQFAQQSDGKGRVAEDTFNASHGGAIRRSDWNAIVERGPEAVVKALKDGGYIHNKIERVQG